LLPEGSQILRFPPTLILSCNAALDSKFTNAEDTMPNITQYLNSDLVLKSRSPINLLCDVFDRECCVLDQQQGEDGNWYATIESEADENLSAVEDIQKMLSVVLQLAGDTKKQWDDCYSREINIGFDCGNTWAYPHSLPNDIVRMIADAGCELAITLYPIREQEEA